MSKLDRPATYPGGMICEDCSKVFTGESWHSWCALCVAVRRGGKTVELASLDKKDKQHQS